MKKILKGLAIATLVATTASATTEKTFLQYRPHGVNAAMEATTWRDLLITDKEDAFGAHFQLIPFYQDSTDDHDIGEYFGIKGKNVFELDTAANNKDSVYGYIIRYDATNARNATIKYDPSQTAYGVRIDYHQDLDKILKGLYFKVNLPIVHVDNDMNLYIISADDARKTELVNFFKGNDQTTTNYTAEGLKYAKIDGSQDQTEVADIDIVLGYNVLNKDKAKLKINVGLTIPTGDDADGVWVFEPIVGNNNHWGLGAGLDFCGKVWEDDDQHIRIDAVANWRYLFESSEKRTLRLKDGSTAFDNTTGSYEYTQYRIVGAGDNSGGNVTADVVGNAKPLANISTLNVDVEPGSQLDAILNFAYIRGGFSVDLGYNLFWKEREDVDKKEELATIENGYKLLNEASIIAQGVRALTTDDLDFASAETPSYVTHKIYGGVGYIFKDWDTPLMFGLAGHYEFAGDEGIENWGIWGKLGIKF